MNIKNKYFLIIIIIFYIKLSADILDNSIKFWYVDKAYKNTQTYKYWKNKKDIVDKNYVDYKHENPYRAVVIESLLETGAMVVSIIGVFEIGTANSVLYVIKNYNSLATLTIPKTTTYIKQIPRTRITNYEKNIVNSGTNIQYKEIKVIQRDFIFKHSKHNIERMKRGKPPIGIDKEPIQLHHLKQQNDGILVEVLAKNEHKKEYKTLHRYKKESEIDRSKFNAFRKRYWKERALRLKSPAKNKN